MQVWWQATYYNKEAARKAAYRCRDGGQSSYANKSTLILHIASNSKPSGHMMAEHTSQVRGH